MGPVESARTVDVRGGDSDACDDVEGRPRLLARMCTRGTAVRPCFGGRTSRDRRALECGCSIWVSMFHLQRQNEKKGKRSQTRVGRADGHRKNRRPCEDTILYTDDGRTILLHGSARKPTKDDDGDRESVRDARANSLPGGGNDERADERRR